MTTEFHHDGHEGHEGHDGLPRGTTTPRNQLVVLVVSVVVKKFVAD